MQNNCEVIMTVAFGSSDGGISKESVDAAFAQVKQIMTNLGHDDGLELNGALADMVGDADSYNALISSSEDFIRANRGFFEHRTASPTMVALWAGLVVGSSVRS
jgi:hypothetical protein